MNHGYDSQNEEVVANAAKRLIHGDDFVHTKFGTTDNAAKAAPVFEAPPSEREDDEFLLLGRPRKNNFKQPASLMATGIEAQVCKDIAERQQFGINKYGQTVADNPLALREWLVHAYQESLDFPIYLKRAIAEIDTATAAQSKGIAERHMPFARYYNAKDGSELIDCMAAHIAELKLRSTPAPWAPRGPAA